MSTLFTLGFLAALLACGDKDDTGSSGGDGGTTADGGTATDGGGTDGGGTTTDGGGTTTDGGTEDNVIGAEGGTVSADGVTLTFPPGAVSSDTTITIEELADEPAPYGLPLYSPVFQFGPDGTTFANPVEVAFDFSGGGDATVYWTTPGGTSWQAIGGTIDGGVITAQVTHFTCGCVTGSGSGSALPPVPSDCVGGAAP